MISILKNVLLLCFQCKHESLPTKSMYFPFQIAKGIHTVYNGYSKKNFKVFVVYPMGTTELSCPAAYVRTIRIF